MSNNQNITSNSNRKLTTPKRVKISENKDWQSPFNKAGFQQSLSNHPVNTSFDRGDARINFTNPIDLTASVVNDDRLSRSSFGRLTDIRQRGAPDSTIYDDLINLILNHKKDIKFAPSCETYEGAKRYAKAHGLRPADKNIDINHDGIKDVVLYNKAGYPVMINGYYLAPSKAPFRQMYREANPTPVDRTNIGGFKGFMNDLWGVQGDFNENGERTVVHDIHNLPAGFANLRDQGWRLPPAPRKQLSFHQLCMRVLGDSFRMFTDQEIFNTRRYLISLLPRLSVLALEYTDIVDRSFINSNPAFKQSILQEATRRNVSPWDVYQEEKKRHKAHFKAYMQDYMQRIIDVCAQPAIFENVFLAIDFEAIMTDESLPTQEQYNEMVSEAKVNHEAKVQLADIRFSLKTELEERVAAAKNDLINDIFTSQVDTVRGVDRTPVASGSISENE